MVWNQQEIGAHTGDEEENLNSFVAKGSLHCFHLLVSKCSLHSQMTIQSIYKRIRALGLTLTLLNQSEIQFTYFNHSK